MTTYPTNLDDGSVLASPVAGTLEDAVGFEHDKQHTNLSDAIKALQAKVGIDASGNPDSIDFKTRAVEGTVTIGNGESTGQVEDLDLAFTPTKVQLTMQSPEDGLFLGIVLIGAPTSDGFKWALSAQTDSGNYKFHYRIS